MKSYIVTEKGMDLLTGLAAKELRRYLYVLGLELPLIVNKMPDSGNAIIAACKGSSLLESYDMFWTIQILVKKDISCMVQVPERIRSYLPEIRRFLYFTQRIIFWSCWESDFIFMGIPYRKRIVLLTYGIGR